MGHTRPKNAFFISVVSQHMHLSKEAHLDAYYKILGYLRGNPIEVCFSKNETKDIESLTM